MGRAGAFGRDHAGADRVIRRAAGAEDGAVLGPLVAAHDGGAFAGLVVGHGPVGETETALGIEIGVGIGQPQGAVGQGAQTAPLERLAPGEHLSHQRLGLEIALVRDGAGEGGLHPVLALDDLAQQHPQRLQQVQRLEARDHDGLAVLAGHGLVGGAADHGGHMAGADEPVDDRWLRPAEDGVHGRWREHVVAQHREVAQPLGVGLEHGHGRGRRGGLEPDGQEHRLLPRMVPRPLQRLQRRGNHAHLGPQRLGFAQRQAVRSRHAQHVAVGEQGHAGLLRQRDGLVDAADGQHADRAAWAMDEAQPRWQQVGQAVAGQGVGVPAAELHHAHLAVGGQGLRDGTGQALRQASIAKGVHQRKRRRRGGAHGKGGGRVSRCSSRSWASVAWASASSITCRAKPTCTIT